MYSFCVDFKCVVNVSVKSRYNTFLVMFSTSFYTQYTGSKTDRIQDSLYNKSSI